MINFEKQEIQYHVVFNSDDNYIKYAAVLITNIINKLNTNKTFFSFCKNVDESQINRDSFIEVFYFHILTDKIKDNRENELNSFANKISQNKFLCKIFLYEVSEVDFVGCPKWNNHDNYLCYYKIKMASFLPNYVKKCLFLDIDMLIMCDLREIFFLDLKNKIAAVTPDCSNAYHDRFVRTIDRKDVLKFSYLHSYFNVGFMLINLDEWRSQNIEKRALMFLKQYVPRVPEQDTLNFIIGDCTIKLEPKWNFFISHFLHDRCEWNNRFSDENLNYLYDYSYKDYMKSLTDIKVIHFTYGIPKPWESLYKELDVKYRPKFYPYYDEWWSYVNETYIFGDIIKRQQENDLKVYSMTLAKKISILESRIRHLESILGYYNLDSAYGVIRNEFYYKIGNVMIKTYKSSYGILKLPFVILKMLYLEYRKNKNISKISNSNFIVPVDLQNYDDFEESSFKVKNHLSYILGKSFLEKPFLFIFNIRKNYLEYKKNNKKRNKYL